MSPVFVVSPTPLGRAEIAALVERPDPGAIPRLLPWVFARGLLRDRARVRDAVLALDRCLAATTARELPSVANMCLAAARWTPTSDAWSWLQPAGLARLTSAGGADVSALAAASFHASGWVREAAVERLDAIGDPRVLRYLLLRVGDWVPQVAAHARAAVERRLDAAHVPLLLEHFEYVARLARSTRRDAGDLVTRVRSLLRDDAALAVLYESLRAPSREVRRLVLELLLDRPDADARWVMEQVLHDADVVVRLAALRLAVTRLDDATLGQVMDMLVRDPFPRIRRDALAHAIAQLGDRAVPWLEAALVDPSEIVREVARFGVRRVLPCTDLRALYRDLVARARASGSGAELASALAGLAATGNAHDVGFVRPFVAHERPRVRRAALRALVRLDHAAARELVVPALEDPSPSVSRAARELLRRDAAWVGVERLVWLLDAARPGHVRANALLLGAQLPKWDVPPLMLSIVGDPSPELARTARRALAGWLQEYNRAFAQPTPPQLERLRAALAHFGDRLERGERAELEAIMRSW